MPRDKKGFWYKKYVGECPVCGKNASYKKRMYTDKPKNKLDRICYLTQYESYCGCAHYF